VLGQMTCQLKKNKGGLCFL